MRVRIYQTTDGRFKLLITEKGAAVGISTFLSSREAALDMAFKFAESQPNVRQMEGGYFVPVFETADGRISFVRCGTEAQALELFEGGIQVSEGLRSNIDLAQKASEQWLINRTAAAIRRFKRSVAAMNRLTQGTVTCTLTHNPSGIKNQIEADSDETVLAAMMSSGRIQQ
jgi:crotonobetainyl-CoA:carnitine CoA-transferase CaiB-like acyl-CoA transferase